MLFIKGKKDFVTKGLYDVFDYEIIDSIYDAYSTITIHAPGVDSILEGDFCYLEEERFLGIVASMEYDGESMIISCSQIINLLGRHMFYTDTSFTYLEDYLKSLIDAAYTNCSDAYYKLPYLTVTAASHTTATLKPDLEDGVYNIKSYTSKARRLKDIYCEWSLTRTALNLSITKKIPAEKNIDFSNPRYVLLDEAFSNKTISKITTYCEETSAYQNWILMEDGTIVNTVPASGRLAGDWETLTVATADELEDSVKDTFATNVYSHNVTFQTDRDFELYDSLNARLDNNIFSSYIAQVIRRKGTQLKEITCGELQVKYPYQERI